MTTQSDAALPAASSGVFRRKCIVAVTASAVLVCLGLTSCTKTQVGLSVAAVAAVVVGTTVGVTLAVQHSHHTLQGCIVSGTDGLELHLNDARAFTLKGELTNIKVGDKLSIHGSKLKKVKGYKGGQVFVVERVNKDYGPCPVSSTASASPAH